ncbi:DUF1484 domain-containing protein [Chromobacterium piscinae]|uniref:DUF1484 domain-containing protein n=1 Tax=Chromobacterium piscinae TaxID=686831 RepID=UPI00140C99F4|nr:DUF1484 domain-containing protein [Chromobacterium piscinae]MCD4502885.1 DUF1484 domain-containing protein [Chromobacterium piscinae]NHQ81965.1 DUF1484 domain-containing protein [Chromobacterium vaccinii]
MPSITRSSSHLALSLKNRHPSRSRWLLNNQAPTHPPSLLAMTRLHEAFAALQEQLAGKDQSTVRAPAARVAHLCHDIEQAVVESICHLSHSQLGLQSVIDLLACLGDDVRLPSSRIKELLEPLDKRMNQSLTLLTRVL